MGNPILDLISGTRPATNQNPVANVAQAVTNPSAFVQNTLQNSPQMKQVMEYVKQNGGDAKAAFYNLAKQKGVNPDDVLAQVRRMIG